MDLAYVKATVSDVNPYYVSLLTWEQQHGIIKATPKKRLSDQAHNSISKVFQKLGGKFVGHAGQAWFELIVLEDSGSLHDDISSQGKVSNVGPFSPSSLQGSCLLQLEAQLASLRQAAQTWLTEA